MDDVVKTVNAIRSPAIKSRLYLLLCDDMSVDQNILLWLCEFRWLSRGKALERMLL